MLKHVHPGRLGRSVTLPVAFSLFALLVAFVFLLVASITTPAVKHLSFMKMKGAVSGDFGAFGFCTNIWVSPGFSM